MNIIRSRKKSPELNLSFILLLVSRIVCPVCVSMMHIYTRTRSNSIKMQEACMCQETVDVIMSQWDDEVKWRGTPQDSNTINGWEDETHAALHSLSVCPG